MAVKCVQKLKNEKKNKLIYDVFLLINKIVSSIDTVTNLNI